MRVLLLNQYYPPDVAPTGVYLHDLARELRRRGHEVHVVCSRRSYDGGQDFPAEATLDGVQVHRVAASGFGRRSFAGKAADYLSFATSMSKKIAALPKPDLALACTTPPWIGLAAPAPHAHWIMDLYPDALAAAGVPGTVTLRPLTRRELRGAKFVLTLGSRMAARAGRYAKNVRHVPLWAPAGLSPRPFPTGPTTLMYSGNLGLGHLFREFLDASLRSKDARWIFAGGGKRMADVEAFVRKNPQAPVEIRPYAPADRLNEHLGSAHIHLVSLDPKWQGILVPSKVQGIFAVGRPILFVGARDNEIADWIAEAGAGWIVAPGDVEGILRAIADPALEKKGAAAAAFAKRRFDRATNVGAVADLVTG